MFAVALVFCVAAAAPPPDGVHVVPVPAAAASGAPKDVELLLETPHLKLARITLRKGTVLAEHSAPMPVTIQILRGAGVIKFKDREERLSPERMVVLGPNVTHAVVPDPNTDLEILIHHLKAGPPPGAGRGPGAGKPGPN
jgi:quercetin dioxygenase-like cupin family protein